MASKKRKHANLEEEVEESDQVRRFMTISCTAFQREPFNPVIRSLYMEQ